MTEIRITRSAGQIWAARFNNQTAPCKTNDCPDKDKALVADVLAVANSIVGMGETSPPPVA
jgi:hypothetical protein